MSEARNAVRKLQHELRTPIGQILGYAEMLGDDLRDRGADDLVPDTERICTAAPVLLASVEAALLDENELRAADSLESTTGESAGSSLAGNGARVLVVDDEVDNRTLLARRLIRAGHAVHGVSSGEAALRAINVEAFDVVLLDYCMPDMDGLETLIAIRAGSSIAELPVIMATASTDRSDVITALARGANDYVTKPIDLDVLLARIRTQLELARAHRAATTLALQLEVRNAFLRRTFGRYISDDVATNLLERPDGLDIAGERRVVTVLMADLRDFTARTERTSPRDIVTILNEYLAAMTDVIDANGGTVDNFMGDGVMALFGAFAAREDDARRVVECAVAMHEALDAVNIRARSRGLDVVEMGIGVATGEVVVGNIGSEQRSKFTAIGSAVNLAARLEGLATAGTVLVAPATYDAVSDAFAFDEVRDLEAKGFDGLVRIRRVARGV